MRSLRPDFLKSGIIFVSFRRKFASKSILVLIYDLVFVCLLPFSYFSPNKTTDLITLQFWKQNWN